MDSKYYTNIYSFFVDKKVETQAQIENIYSKLQIGTTLKTTKKDRMQLITNRLLEVLKDKFDKKIDICDFGISSGHTTLDMLTLLKQNELVNSIHGFDRQIDSQMIILSKFIFLFTKQNELMFAEYNKYALRLRFFYPLKKIEKILYKLLTTFSKNIIDVNIITDDLVKSEEFSYDEQNIFDIDDKYSQKFDFVRVANLLNKAYFSDELLKTGLQNITKILKEDGILLVCRTNSEDIDNGTFFVKKNGNLEVLEDFNKGSEVKDLI